MAKSTIHIQLLVVLWKNFIIRKFHWFLTLCEIVIPVILFIMVAYGRDQLSDLGKQYEPDPFYNPQRPTEEFYHQKFDHNFKIYYAPTTSFSSDLIRNVQVLFALPNDAIISFTSVSALNSYYEKHGITEDGVMAVIFKNLLPDSVPKQLNYIIRPYEKDVYWETHHLYNGEMSYIPELGSQKYIDKGFMALKMALDMSFLEIATGQKSPVSIVMQEFPYPPHYNDMGTNNIFARVLPIVTVFSFVFLCPSVLKRVVEEKSTGIKELMKMMGLKSWMLWLGWFLHAFLVYVISVIIIMLLMKGIFFNSQHPVLEFCSGSVFTVFLLLYTAAGITFFFALSTLFNKPTLAMVVGILVWFLTYIIPNSILGKDVAIKWYKKMFASLLPNVALGLGYSTIATFESREVGVSWSNLFTPSSGGSEDIAMGHIFIILIVDTILYTLLAMYIEAVNPGQYGLARPLNFPIRWISKHIFKQRKGNVIDSAEVEVFREYCKVEIAPNLKPGIQVKNLYKKFGKQSVVNDLSIDIYEGQITALLGHNGAGKTTTMSIMTGLIGPTSGKVLISGKDIKYHMDEVRDSLGLCPQHNLQFNDLTVMQHLIFFGMLKGMSKTDAIKEGESLLSLMSISQKRDYLTANLSGGMRRKLSVAIALIGNTKVVILDEPTSGLDPESRRELWDMLLSLRGSRTILITTHFMEEADVLGDRIAIMDHGRLMCYGTSMFLKKEFGAGYHLSLIRDNTKTVSNQVRDITNLITSIIAKAVLEGDTGNYITFLLPHDSKSQFSALFQKLEDKKNVLGISTISLSITTLEEVFLRVGNMVSKEENNKSKSNELGSTKSSTSCCSKRTKLQVWSLFKKRILVAKKKWLVFVSQGIRNIEFYNQHMIVAAEFNKTGGKKVINAMYSNNAVHGAPISFNLVINAVLKGMKGEEYGIISGNSPLPIVKGEYSEEASEIDVASLWLLIFPLGMLFISGTFVLFPHMERVTNIKQLQLMCGVRSILYWISCYVWDLILYFTALLLIIFVVVMYGFMFSNVFSGRDEIEVLFAILTAYGFSVIPFAYLFSYKKTAAGAFATFLISNLFTSVIMTAVVMFLQLTSDTYREIAAQLKYVLFLFPQFGLTFNCVQFSKKAVRNFNWKIKSQEQKRTLCQISHNPCCGDEKSSLCINYKSYMNGDDPIGPSLIEMLSSTILYFTILLFLETNIVYKIWDQFVLFVYNQIHRKHKFEGHDVVDSAENEDVCCESKRVCNTLQREKSLRSSGIKQDLLLVHNLQKIYGGQKVVKGISFGIKPGDCFGLLGVNGAGKTTTFRMLTGDQPLLDGEARIHSTDGDAYISKESKKYLEKVGYCPQFDAINEVLTGREMLRLFAGLRGIHEGVEEEVNMWLQALGSYLAKEFADNLCGIYSGGNKRKLNIAMALIGSPLIVMLDEPTSGVDPISRRKLWDTIGLVQSQAVKPSIILTSHSMEECEVLCNKLAIMKAGVLECYGTIPQLKEKYGQGFTVMLKLKNLLHVVICSDDTDSTASQSQPLSATLRGNADAVIHTNEDPPDVKKLIIAFENQYKGFCTLRDKHTGLLHYHINDKNKKWSQMFKEIETLQQAHSVIEDYNISETTLEEVFLSIARSDRKPTTEIVL
ncbi:hypothetical protein RI129_003862 [Pyrocoelia pectoralis]|uniref:ABC transporter domain-containing protein n=1 Tax=Pyrocoelia pectoralis TaxID=417401 RepID=A0AAN7VHL3_9COLE